MNILPKKGVVGRTNAEDIFIWKYICVHQMVKIPVSPEKKSEEKNWMLSHRGNGGMPTRMEKEIKDKHNFYHLLISHQDSKKTIWIYFHEDTELSL